MVAFDLYFGALVIGSENESENYHEQHIYCTYEYVCMCVCGLINAYSWVDECNVLKLNEIAD